MEGYLGMSEYEISENMHQERSDNIQIKLEQIMENLLVFEQYCSYRDLNAMMEAYVATASIPPYAEEDQCMKSYVLSAMKEKISERREDAIDDCDFEFTQQFYNKDVEKMKLYFKIMSSFDISSKEDIKTLALRLSYMSKKIEMVMNDTATESEEV